MKVCNVEEASLFDVGTRRHTICERGEMMNGNWSRRDELADLDSALVAFLKIFKNFKML